MTPRAVSIIVLTHNGRRWLEGCVDAVLAQRDAPDFELILVDNASSDGAAEFVRQRYPAVRVLETGANLGFAGGNNAGARVAHGRLLVFLNDDTRVEPNWLARLVAPFASHPAVGLVSSLIVSLEDPDRVDSAGDGYLRAGGAFKRGHGAPIARYSDPGEVFGACGAAFAVRREIFEALGGFDESFFMVYEDVDLSYRARLRGHACWFAADAVVRHAGSGTLGTESARAVFYGQRNLEWTWLKNTPGPLLLRSCAAHAIYSAAGLAYYARRGLLGPAIRGKVAALRGLPQVLRARRTIQRERRHDASIAWLMSPRWWRVKRGEKQAVAARVSIR